MTTSAKIREYDWARTRRAIDRLQLQLDDKASDTPGDPYSQNESWRVAGGFSSGVLPIYDTSGIEAGMPVFFSASGTDYYGIITAVSADTSITVSVAGGVSDGVTPTDLRFCSSGLSVVLNAQIEGTYANSTGSKFFTGSKGQWRKGEYRLVLAVYRHSADGGGSPSQPDINVQAESTDMLSADITPTTTFQTASGSAIEAANNTVLYGNTISVDVTTAATGASLFTLQLTLVPGRTT